MSPTSEARFLRFKRSLTQVVSAALRRGWTVSASRSDIYGPRKCCCPLGCHPSSDGPKPAEWDAAPLWRIPKLGAFAFACGFDGDAAAHVQSENGLKFGPVNPYYLLGQEYRRRFP